MEISIIIPARNEADVIKKTILEFSRSFPKAEIIVVDDGSEDETYGISKSMGSKKIKVIRLPKKSGKGAAVMEGVRHATKKLVAFADADGAFGPADLSRLVRELNGYDCVIASKWKGKKFGEVDGSFPKKIFGRLWNTISRLLLGLEFDDTQAGLKLFRSGAIKKIGRIFGKGFEFDAEILYRMKKGGMSIKEVFVRPKHIKKSSFSYLNIPLMLFNMLAAAVLLKLFSKYGRK
ncbi:MAG: glycosyltransferase [Candidatus Aenigmarchaeota archaeon]|nr:glycosyltransferase [Candidatus Aenigmarchaeota archaeon]